MLRQKAINNYKLERINSSAYRGAFLTFLAIFAIFPGRTLPQKKYTLKDKQNCQPEETR